MKNGTAELRNPDLISNGRIVPARRGTLFGVTVQSERPIPFAEFKMFKPGGKTADVWRSSIGESYAFRGFRFDSRKEIVTGMWRMDAYDGKRLLFRIEFLVVPWHQMPNISSKSCPFEGIDF